MYRLEMFINVAGKHPTEESTIFRLNLSEVRLESIARMLTYASQFIQGLSWPKDNSPGKPAEDPGQSTSGADIYVLDLMGVPLYAKKLTPGQRQSIEDYIFYKRPTGI